MHTLSGRRPRVVSHVLCSLSEDAFSLSLSLSLSFSLSHTLTLTLLLDAECKAPDGVTSGHHSTAMGKLS